MTEPRSGAEGAPDITDTVMQRLGYRKVASVPERRAWRRRIVVIRLLQAGTVATALALLATWWLGGFDRTRPQPAVADALRGSVSRSAGRLDAILLGLPRVPQQSPVQSADAERAGPSGGAGEQPSGVRSY